MVFCFFREMGDMMGSPSGFSFLFFFFKGTLSLIACGTFLLPLSLNSKGGKSVLVLSKLSFKGDEELLELVESDKGGSPSNGPFLCILFF